LESIDIKPRQAQRFIKIANEFSNTTTSSYLGMNVLYEIATMPPEERDQAQQLDSGETKKPDEMTVRELRETKRKLAAAYSENMANQTLLTQADKKAQKLQAQVTKLQRDPEIKQELQFSLLVFPRPLCFLSPPKAHCGERSHVKLALSQKTETAIITQPYLPTKHT